MMFNVPYSILNEKFYSLLEKNERSYYRIQEEVIKFHPVFLKQSLI